MFKKLSEQLKANPRTIVFTEGTDARILEAADKLINKFTNCNIKTKSCYTYKKHNGRKR